MPVYASPSLVHSHAPETLVRVVVATTEFREFLRCIVTLVGGDPQHVPQPPLELLLPPVDVPVVDVPPLELLEEVEQVSGPINVQPEGEEVPGQEFGMPLHVQVWLRPTAFALLIRHMFAKRDPSGSSSHT